VGPTNFCKTCIRSICPNKVGACLHPPPSQKKKSSLLLEGGGGGGLPINSTNSRDNDVNEKRFRTLNNRGHSLMLEDFEYLYGKTFIM
jgi:hypothetical protein